MSDRPDTAVGFSLVSRAELTLPYGEVQFDSRSWEYVYEDKDSSGRPIWPYKSRRVPRTPETPVGQVKELGDEAVDWSYDPYDVRVTSIRKTLYVSFGNYFGDDEWEEFLGLKLDRTIKTLDKALELEEGKSLPKLRNFPHITRANKSIYVVELPCGDVLALHKETLRKFSAALKKAEKALA